MSMGTPVISDRKQDGSRRLEVTPENWQALHAELQSNGFVRFEWLTAVHNLADDFEVVSMLATNDLSQRLIVSVTCTISGLVSLSQMFPIAEFHEKEVRQMFGLQFEGLIDGDAFDAPFDGHPLRRDFPLQKRAEKAWPGAVEPDPNMRRRPSLPPGVFAEWSS